MSSRGTALVVDDDSNTRLLLQKFLIRKGFEVDLAEHGGKAIERLQARDYGVVMLDLMMPVLDGHAVLAFLRQENPTLLHRIVVVSAYPGPLNATDLGVRAVVSKPFTFDLLSTVLEGF